jgi:TetR/AcrR family transcriptional regulator
MYSKQLASAIDAPSNRFKAGSLGDKNHRKVLAAAAKVFSRKGYNGARVDEIARLAGMSKPNMLYYFKTKHDLYRVVMEDVLSLWLNSIGDFCKEAEPAEVMAQYVAKKMQLSQQYPEASRIIAMELISGSPVIGDYLRTGLRDWVADKGAVFLQWQAEGLMQPIEPAHAFFIIWATTQTYADFESQIGAVLAVDDYNADVYPTATKLVTEVLIRGFGLKSRTTSSS